MKILVLIVVLLFSNIVVAENEFIDVYELTPETLYKTNKEIPISGHPPDHDDSWEDKLRSLKYLPAGSIIRFTGKHYYDSRSYPTFWYTVRADVSGIGKVAGWVNPVALLGKGTIVRLKEKLHGDTSDTDEVVGDTFRDCATCPEMVVVPSGNFMMGSPEGEKYRGKDEGPQHRVTISKPFAVGKYEVTVGQFEEFANETKHPNNEWRDPGFEQSANHPVVYVSWNDAQTYADWLSTKTGHNYRLLSEAEWEYVARAGTTTAYHFGLTISGNQVNYGKKTSGTIVVGSYPANKFGLHDVHGNVFEWVEDCLHTTYRGAPRDGSAWISGCEKDERVLRGGSWKSNPRYLRSAYRGWDFVWVRDDYHGFRIARTLNP